MRSHLGYQASMIMTRSLALLLIVFVTRVGAAAAAEEGTFTDLGAQITSATIQGTTFARDEKAGKDLACTVVRGEPAKLLVFDIASGELLQRLAMPGAKGAWNATTTSDGSVYVGTDDNGHLYRWTPGESQIADLGQVADAQTFVWDETPGPDGDIYVGTYPGCLLMRYRPGKGFTNVCNGPATPGENYARSVTYDPDGEKIYVGVGEHARLIEVDPKTGASQDILPTEYASKHWCYSVRMSGGKLFALVQEGQLCLVIDPATRKVEQTLIDVPAQLVVSPKSPYDDKVYFRGQTQLRWYDLKTRETGNADVPNSGGITGMSWLNGELVMLTVRGNVVRFDPRNGKSSTLKLTIPPEETPIQSIARGPDGKIYCGGYLSGGLSSYDPKTGKHEQFNGISQSESMGVLGERLYHGVYPHARLYATATTQPWKPGDGPSANPRKLDQLDRVGQVRPMATLGVEPLGKVFYGTVPDYGTLGGTLSIYDATTDKVDVHRNIVEDQSVINLCYTSGLIIGGTTRSGGLGIEPKAESAKLFGYDPRSNEKVFETVPEPKAWLITGLVVDAEKRVWGVADETLFCFDVAKREVVSTQHLFDSNENTRHAHWRDAFMTLHPRDGQIYGTMGGKLFRLDPRSREVTVLWENGAVLLARDLSGRIYFRSDRTHLWQYTPPGIEAGVAAQSATPSATPPGTTQPNANR